jgi:ketosteroid isomerase-like protein
VDANDELIQRFYAAFDRADGDGMAACYTPDATFSDPVFPDLHGQEVGAMWRMLAGRSTDLEVELREHSAEGDTGSARWIATYTFTRSDRKVVNDVQASFRFRNGLIAEHHDEFDFWKWSRQAFGTMGTLLGWGPILRDAVRRRAGAELREFMATKEVLGVE